MRCRRLLVAACGASLWATFGIIGPASAHVNAAAGPLRVAIGWEKEPAYAGLENSVQVQVTDESGAPVADVGSSLIVELSFNDDRVVMPLLPSGRPGEVQAVIVPTRPGIYSFHTSGKVRDQSVDINATCGENTFACVADASEVQFPVKDPSVGQFAQRLGREASRVSAAQSDASNARLVALVAIVVAAAALAFAAILSIQARRSRSRPDAPQRD